MNEFLERAERFSKGYIDDPNDIKRITDSLMSETLLNLKTANHNTPILGKYALEDTGLPRDNPDSILFGELLGMLRLKFNDIGSDDEAMQLKILMENTSQTLTKVKMFMAVTIKGLTEFFDSKSGSQRFYAQYEKLRIKAWRDCNIDITCKTTVKQFFDLLGPFNRWKSFQPMEKFEARAHSCCQLIRILFIDCLYEGYREQFGMRNLKRKLEPSVKYWDYSNFDTFVSRYCKDEKLLPQRDAASADSMNSSFEITDFSSTDEAAGYDEDSGNQSIENKIRSLIRKNQSQTTNPNN